MVSGVALDSNAARTFVLALGIKNPLSISQGIYYYSGITSQAANTSTALFLIASPLPNQAELSRASPERAGE